MSNSDYNILCIFSYNLVFASLDSGFHRFIFVQSETYDLSFALKLFLKRFGWCVPPSSIQEFGN